MRLLFATSCAVLAIASPAFATPVTNVTVENASPSSAAGARTVYVVTFTTSPTGALPAHVGTVDVTFPAGTTFDGLKPANGWSCSPSGPTLHCQTAFAFAGSQEVSLKVGGVDNPAEGTGKTVTVATSADTDPVQSAPFAVTPARPVAGVGVGVHLPGPSDAVYEIDLATSTTGAPWARTGSSAHRANAAPASTRCP